MDLVKQLTADMTSVLCGKYELTSTVHVETMDGRIRQLEATANTALVALIAGTVEVVKIK